MYFDNLSDLPTIATQTSCAVFVVPPDTLDGKAIPTFKNALFLTPDESKTTRIISVEQIRDFLALSGSRETRDRFFIITPADAMNEAAQNAFLKTFEEPNDFCHFVLLTESPSSLLPTILSRAQVFFPRVTGALDAAPVTNDKTAAAKAKMLDQAKRLVSASARDLPELATEFAKVKNKPREQALDTITTAIDLLYKSYFKTANPRFLTKLPNFLALYDAIQKGGHIKLHIVADLC